MNALLKGKGATIVLPLAGCNVIIINIHSLIHSYFCKLQGNVEITEGNINIF